MDDGVLALEGRDLLQRYTRIAMVGLSANPSRPSYRVAVHLIAYGYDVTPVNPTVDEVLGIPAVPTLAEAGPLEIVDVFRRPSEVPAVVDEAIALGAKAIWLQLGLRDDAAAARARAAGIAVRAGPLHQDGALPLVRRAQLVRARDRRRLVPPRGGGARACPLIRAVRLQHAADPRRPARRRDHGRARAADLPDGRLRLRGLPARGRPLRPQPLRQHLHAHRQPDERRVRGAHGDARGRGGGARDGLRAWPPPRSRC